MSGRIKAEHRAVSTRRTKAELDPSILGKIIAIVSVGAGKDVAAAQAGVSSEALYQYVDLGRSAHERIAETPDEPWSERERVFGEFYSRFQKAETHQKAYMLGIITKASAGDWRAGAWILEKLYPSEYGSRVKIEADVQVKATPPDLSKLSVEQLRALREIQGILKGD